MKFIVNYVLLFYFSEETSEYRLRQVIENETVDLKYGFEGIKDHKELTGFLLNMHAVSI